MKVLSAISAAAPAVGSAPPGTTNLATIVSWVAFLVGVALIGAFMAMMGKAGMSALRHGQFEGGAGAAMCLVAGVFLTAAGPIFAALGIATA